MPNKVYVISKHGRPLMPCSPAKARHLLDAGKAKVKKRTPFTIQLVYGSSGYTQEVILGVDAGSKTIGVSASTKLLKWKGNRQIWRRMKYGLEGLM